MLDFSKIYTIRVHFYVTGHPGFSSITCISGYYTTIYDACSLATEYMMSMSTSDFHKYPTNPFCSNNDGVENEVNNTPRLKAEMHAK